MVHECTAAYTQMVRTFTPGRVRVCASSGARDGAGTAQGRLSYAVRGRPQAKFGSKGADNAVSDRWKEVSLKAISSSPPCRARSLRASAPPSAGLAEIRGNPHRAGHAYRACLLPIGNDRCLSRMLRWPMNENEAPIDRWRSRRSPNYRTSACSSKKPGAIQGASLSTGADA